MDFDLHGRPPFVPPPLLELDEWPPCSLGLDLHHLLYLQHPNFSYNNFGGSIPSAVAVAAPAAGAVQEEGPSTVNVTLTAAGANKIAVIKLVREITGLGLKEAKEIADNGGVVKENVSADEANEMKAKFEEAGASIELK